MPGPVAGLGAGTGHPARLITALNYFGAVVLVEGVHLLARGGELHLLLVIRF